jgi:hypothetical protein
MLGAIITICGGVLAASVVVLTRRPDADELMDDLTPYLGWTGIAMFFWAVWELIGAVRYAAAFGAQSLETMLWLASGAACLGVGFFLAFGLLTTYALANSQLAIARRRLIRERVVVLQVPVGFAAMAMGGIYALFIVIR